MRKTLCVLIAVLMLVSAFPLAASADSSAEFLTEITDVYDVAPGYRTVGIQNRRTGMYMLYDENLNPVGDAQYIYMRANSEAREQGYDFYSVALEEGINVTGSVDGNGQTLVPMQYAKVEFLSPRWQYGYALEKSSPAGADVTDYDGNAYIITNYDFYYRGQKVLTLGREDFNGTCYAYGDYLILRDLEKTIHAYDKTGAVSYDGMIEYTSEYDGYRTYIHVPTGSPAFCSECTLQPDEVKQDLLADGGSYYDLQGNPLKLENSYSSVYKFEGSYARVERQGKYGLINREGREVVPCMFDSSGSYEMAAQLEKYGYAASTVDGKFCYVNANGEITFQSSYSADIVKGSRGIVRYVQDLTGEYIVLTPAGQLEEKFADYPELFSGSTMFKAVEADGSVCLFDIWGNQVLSVRDARDSVYMNGNGTLFFVYMGDSTYYVYSLKDENMGAVAAAPAPGQGNSVSAHSNSSASDSSSGESWTCPECGNENTGNFCGNCGTPKPVEEDPFWTCPNCQTVNEGNFCSNCGTSRESAAAREPGKSSVSAAPTSVRCMPGDEVYTTQYQWGVPVYEPETLLEDCHGFTVSLCYHAIPDPISLGYQRVFCRVNGHFTEVAAINVEELDKTYTAGVSFNNPATVDGFAVQPMKNPRSGIYDMELILTDIMI